MVASEDALSGNRVCDEDGSSRGVEVLELSADGGRTRFARRKKKKAFEGMKGQLKDALIGMPGAQEFIQSK